MKQMSVTGKTFPRIVRLIYDANLEKRSSVELFFGRERNLALFRTRSCFCRHGKFVLMNSLFQSQVFCHAQVVKDELLIWNLSGCSFKNKSTVFLLWFAIDLKLNCYIMMSLFCF